ncbi:MAG: indolepyruvate oxidoreductase subunit beta family protein [Allosphingosinicella sp.]
MSGRAIRISIHALGGQGGGVLADWIVDLAEAEGWTAQATSVPGVAQRTGATVYYVELAPPGPAPVMALMPTPGDVDIVLAAELMEAGRAIARGLVTPDRTLLIASSHRVFAISEKAAMGSGIVSPARVVEAAQASAKRLILADLAALAERHGSAISAALFGALAGSGALPFPPVAFEEAIRRSGKGVERSIAALRAGLAVAAGGGEAPSAPAAPAPAPPEPEDLPEPARPIAQLGIERLRDYQGSAYAEEYRDRLHRIAEADRALGGAGRGFGLTEAAARHLALWMAYEDVIRVADLKTRPARARRVREEARAAAGQVVHTTEFLHPRFEEICDMLPARIGERLLGSPRARRRAEPLTAKGRFVTTTRLPGFLLLWTVARLRRYRPRTLRWRDEQARIEGWLESAVNAARTDYALGVEILRLQRLVKGYGDTHARGLRSFALILAAVPQLQGRGDAAALVAELHEAALKDDEGAALGRAMRAIGRRTGIPLAASGRVIIHAEY